MWAALNNCQATRRMRTLFSIFLLCFVAASVHANCQDPLDQHATGAAAKTIQRFPPPREEHFWLFNGPGGIYGFDEGAGLSHDGQPYASSVIVVADKMFFLPCRVTTIGNVMLIIIAVSMSAFLFRQLVISREHETHVA